MGKSMDEEFIKVNHLLIRKQYDAAREIMLTWNLKRCTQFYINNQTLLSRLSSPKLKLFWQRKIYEFKMQSLPDFELLPQENFSFAQLLLGLGCYLLAMNAKNNQNQVDYALFLQGGLKLESIYALQAFVSELFFSGENTKKNLDNLILFLNDWEPLAHKQGTPGYLALANGYLQAAYQAMLAQQKLRAANLFQNSWLFLHLAQLCQPKSTLSIHNAYFGQGLQLSNSAKLKDCETMKIELKKCIQDWLVSVNFQAAENQANQLYDQYWQDKTANDFEEEISYKP